VSIEIPLGTKEPPLLQAGIYRPTYQLADHNPIGHVADIFINPRCLMLMI